MKTIEVRGTAKRRVPGTSLQAITGVNASGNLEVLVERVMPGNECMVQVTTAVAGFGAIWRAVIEEFFERGAPGGLRFSINDGGARPDTVTLRLMQSVRLMEMAK